MQPNVIQEPESHYSYLNVSADNLNNIIWCEMKNDSTACFTSGLLDELNESVTYLKSVKEQHFFVLSSATSSVFSLGGDLVLFSQLVKQKNEEALNVYMKNCIDTLYNISSMPNFERIAMVRGIAFGGGFEAALACDTIIAEENSQFGFPDRLFNSFPGMGAYSYLIRRVTPATAKRIIKSTKTYSASELFELGIVDKVVPEGEGHTAVYNHIHHYQRYNNGYNALKDVFKTVHPLNYDELLNVGQIWVKNILELSDKDIGLMSRLALSQKKLIPTIQ